MGYGISFKDRKEKADEIIALLSGFGLSRDDARGIFSIGYTKLCSKDFTDAQYHKSGASVSVVAGVDRSGGPASDSPLAVNDRDNRDARQRTFHEPQEPE